MSRIPTLILSACAAVAGAGFVSTAAAQTADTPPKPAAPSKKAKAAAPAAKTPAPAPQAAPAAPTEDPTLTLFRHDLINLLALSGDARKQVAAAQLAAPDEKDATRSAVKKTSALLKRALE